MKRVVITGTGVVSSIGLGTNNYLKSLKSGSCMIKDAEFGSIRVPSALVHLNGKNSKGLKGYKMASIAIEEAVHNAQIDPLQITSHMLGIVAGTMNATLSDLVDRFHHFSNEELNYIDKCMLSRFGHDSITDYLYHKYKMSGNKMTVSNSCATGICVIQQAKEFIENGYCDICIAAGVDLVNTVSVLPLNTLRIIDKDTIRPFDMNRKGTVLGDGAGVMVLESLESAQKRSVPILAEVLGISVKNEICDTYFSSSKEGNAIIDAMREAVDLSGITLNKIDYINAHGTGAPQNDLVESNSIKSVFGERAYRIPVSSTKSFIGHTGAAAGILEIIASILCMNSGIIHPTLHYVEKDPLCDLYYVPNQAIKRKVDYFIKNSIGFGGINASAVISRYAGGGIGHGCS